MNFGKFRTFLFLIFETYLFYLAIGETVDKEQNDCTKIYNFLNQASDNQNYQNCSNNKIFNDQLVFDEQDNLIYYYHKNKNLDLNSFPYFSKIERLELGYSELNEIPKSILNLTTLVLLKVNLNNIEVIPPEIQNLKQLSYLDLSYNNIKELPKELFNLKNLTILNLSNNKLKYIPPDIQNLSNLNQLDLLYNDIKELPSEIYNLKNLNTIKFEAKKSNSLLFIIIGCCIIALVSILVATFIIIKKKRSKQNKESDEFRHGSIKVYFNNPFTEINNNINHSSSSSSILNDSKEEILYYSKSGDKAMDQPPPVYKKIN